jgi:hypothetical protein
MPFADTVRVDVRQAILATAAALADGSTHLSDVTFIKSAAIRRVAQHLVTAELSLIQVARAQVAHAAKRYAAAPAKSDPLLVLNVDRRDVEAFSGNWLDVLAPEGPRSAAWQMAHLLNAIDFGRWLVSLSASTLAAKRGFDPDLQTDAVRAILQLDIVLVELTRAYLGHRADSLVDWKT